MFNEQWLAELKSKSDIVDVLSKFVYLEKKGSKYWACCPFHNEKTASFVVNPREQYYHCFSCKASGTVITFLMEHEKMTYREAIEWLAKRAGMTMPEEEDPKARQARKQRESALAAAKEAAHFYFEVLRSERGEPARSYLAERGIQSKTVTEFGLGYSPDYDSLPRYLSSKGYSVETMLYAGLVTRNDQGRISDFQAKRLIVPIINARGQVIGFGGRVIEKDKFPKYKNTSGTALFDKRRTIFGLNRIRKLQQSEDQKALILVEGYMDVISLTQAGIVNSVASMGTALTPEQCKELKRFVNLIYVCFDGDAAGQSATWRSLDLLKEAGLEVKVVSIPDGMDPDDAVKKGGKEGFSVLLDRALPLIEFKLQTVAARYRLDSPDGRNKFAKAALAVLHDLDEITRDVYIQVVSEMSKLSPESIANSLRDYRVETPRSRPTQAEESPAEDGFVLTPELRARIIAARYLLSSVFAHKDYVTIDALQASYFDYPVHKSIYEYLMRCVSARRRPVIGDLYDLLPEGRGEIDKMIEAIDKVSLDKQLTYYQECIRQLDAGKVQKRKKEIIEALKTATDPDTVQALKEELRKLTTK